MSILRAVSDTFQSFSRSFCRMNARSNLYKKIEKYGMVRED